MSTKSERFQNDLIDAVGDILNRVNLEDRTDNEIDAYLNRIVEDLTHDVDRFARSGNPGASQHGTIEREKRTKEERLKATVISMLNKADFDNLDERQVRDLKNKLENSVVSLMGRLGVQPADDFVGETAEDLIEMTHKQDWLNQHIMVAMSNYALYDLSAGEIRELHVEIENILKGLES